MKNKIENKTVHHEDEIDLIELVKTVWGGEKNYSPDFNCIYRCRTGCCGAFPKGVYSINHPGSANFQKHI
jgi:hypothetical protein